MIIGINPFFLQSPVAQTLPISLDTLLAETKMSFDFGHFRHGYREGVILVKINPLGFKTRVITLKEGMPLSGSYKARVPGETPRKQTGTIVASAADLPDAAEVEVVLYAERVLAEKDEPRTGCDWDIITVLAHPTPGGAPMSPGTLMANHFGASGGTDTKMSSGEFEKALRESFLYWSDKAIAEVPSV